jgi:ArsR family transcriptional regulator
MDFFLATDQIMEILYRLDELSWLICDKTHVDWPLYRIIILFNGTNMMTSKNIGVETYEPQAKLFKALMHPVRLEILDILRDGEECVCHMEAILGYRQAYISQHLSVLRDAGLVQVRRDGWNIFYRVIKPEVFELLEKAGQVIGEKTFEQKHKARSKKKPCPCPKCNPVVEGAES